MRAADALILPMGQFILANDGAISLGPAMAGGPGTTGHALKPATGLRLPGADQGQRQQRYHDAKPAVCPAEQPQPPQGKFRDHGEHPGQADCKSE